MKLRLFSSNLRAPVAITTFFLVATSTICLGSPLAIKNNNSTIPERITFIVEGCHKFKTTKAQCAYILATTEHETAYTWLPVREAFWLSESWRQANHWYYPYDGRGYVQLTHGYNYKRMGAKLGIDLYKNPSLAMDSHISREILFRGMLDGDFTGLRLGQFIVNSLTHSYQARRVVNGLDKAQQISNRAHFWYNRLTVY